jgi:hypothetical protein
MTLTSQRCGLLGGCQRLAFADAVQVLLESSERAAEHGDDLALQIQDCIHLGAFRAGVRVRERVRPAVATPAGEVRAWG